MYNHTKSTNWIWKLAGYSRNELSLSNSNLNTLIQLKEIFMDLEVWINLRIIDTNRHNYIEDSKLREIMTTVDKKIFDIYYYLEDGQGGEYISELQEKIFDVQLAEKYEYREFPLDIPDSNVDLLVYLKDMTKDLEVQLETKISSKEVAQYLLDKKLSEILSELKLKVHDLFIYLDSGQAGQFLQQLKDKPFGE